MGTTEIAIFIFSGFLVFAISIGIIALFIVQYRKRKILHEREKQTIYELHQKEMLTAELEIQQHTMQHIGREIHDNVGQKLTLAALYAQQIDYENRFPELKEKIISVAEIINESLHDLRSLSKNLVNTETENITFITLLRQQCERVKSLQTCEVIFETTFDNIDIDNTIKNILIRIIQEFIQNSLKHSGCTKILLNVSTGNDQLYINISDNGKGFDPNATQQGIGLLNMEKRTSLIGAQSIFKSAENSGTFLQLIIPLKNVTT